MAGIASESVYTAISRPAYSRGGAAAVLQSAIAGPRITTSLRERIALVKEKPATATTVAGRNLRPRGHEPHSSGSRELELASRETCTVTFNFVRFRVFTPEAAALSGARRLTRGGGRGGSGE